MKRPLCPTCATPLAWDRARQRYEHCHQTRAASTLIRKAGWARRALNRRQAAWRRARLARATVPG
jgi:hypothetical protein